MLYQCDYVPREVDQKAKRSSETYFGYRPAFVPTPLETSNSSETKNSSPQKVSIHLLPHGCIVSLFVKHKMARGARHLAKHYRILSKMELIMVNDLPIHAHLVHRGT
jgi:hypothetical protein